MTPRDQKLAALALARPARKFHRHASTSTLEFARRRGTISAADIIAEFGVGRSAAFSRLEKLTKAGLLVRVIRNVYRVAAIAEPTPVMDSDDSG